MFFLNSWTIFLVKYLLAVFLHRVADSHLIRAVHYRLAAFAGTDLQALDTRRLVSDHPVPHYLQAHLRPSADRLQGHAVRSQKHHQAAYPVAVICALPASLFKFLALAFA